MGRVRLTLAHRAAVLMIRGRRLAHLLLGAGAVLAVAGVWMLTGPGVALLTAGTALVVHGFFLVDVPSDPERILTRPPRG